MTYDDDHLIYNVKSRFWELNIRDTQLFIKRLRKAQAQVSSDRLRYYLAGEYGTISDRPHYHVIMFNLHSDLLGFSTDCLIGNDSGVLSPELGALWRGGLVHVGNCNAKSINYVTKYVINHTQGPQPLRQLSFSTQSRKPGLGSCYIITHKQWHLNGYRNFTKVNGVQSRLPRFLRDRIFAPWDRAYMARQTIKQMDEAYNKELIRLADHHSCPTSYIEERTAAAHQAITRRLNEKNKF